MENRRAMVRFTCGNNKFDLLLRIRHIAMAERFEGNRAHWWVEDEGEHIVFDASYIPGVGIRYWINNYIIYC